MSDTPRSDQATEELSELANGVSADVSADVVRRLRRIEGQVRGLQQMLLGERSCTEVMTQLSAVRKALQQTGLLVVADRLHQCATPQAEGGAKIDDVERLFMELR